MRKLAWACAVALIGLATGCGNDQAAETVTEERTIIEKAPAAETVTQTVRAKPAPKPKPKPPAAHLITVPDVVGMNHQYAQDEMQAAGLYHLDERDATGQGRVLLWDRNWVVVSQDPPAGAEVDENTTITLSSKKGDE